MPVLISGASWQAHCPRPSPRRGLPPQTLAWGFLLRGLEGQGDQAFGSRQSLPSPPHPSFTYECFPRAYCVPRAVEGSGRKGQVHCPLEPTIKQEPQGWCGP